MKNYEIAQFDFSWMLPLARSISISIDWKISVTACKTEIAPVKFEAKFDSFDQIDRIRFKTSSLQYLRPSTTKSPNWGYGVICITVNYMKLPLK